MKRFCSPLLLLVFAVTPLRGTDESLVVVATRYLKAQGVSHAHLYLYKEDGTFLRQLTKSGKGQDHDPLFSPSGDEIVFVRTSDSEDGKEVVTASTSEPASLEYWQVASKGGDLRRLDAVPDWYRAASNTIYFQQCFGKDSAEELPKYGEANKGWDDQGKPWPNVLNSTPFSFTSPDGKYQLMLKIGTNDLDWNGPGNGALYELKNIKSGRTWKLGELPDFLGLTDLLHESSNPKNLFLQQGALNVVFFTLHMGSTFGEACIALELNKPKLMVLPGNKVPFTFRDKQDTPAWESLLKANGNATPIPLSGEPYFLARGTKRYEPIPGSGKTANISFLAIYDSSLKETPYVKLRTAPQFYGASIYRANKSPTVMKVSENIGED